MTDYSHAADIIARELAADDANGSVVLLSGPWGCGKSYLWSAKIQPRLERTNNITVSLFGLGTSSELKTRIMNAALVLRARSSLKEKEFKKLAADSPAILVAGAKVLLKGLDSYIGTNLLSTSVDPLTLVPDGLIICIDDIDRAAFGFDIVSLLGVANQLAETKKARLLLILDEEQLNARSPEAAEELKRFSERVVSRHVRIDADPDAIFEEFVRALRADAVVRASLAQHKRLVTAALRAAEVTNLRTLKRILSGLAELRGALNAQVPDSAAMLCASLIIENTLGRLQPPERYLFSQYKFLINSPEQSEERNAQDAFYRRYFLNCGVEYKFYSSIYDCVALGFSNKDELKEQIFPPARALTDADRILRESGDVSWQYYSDSEYETWAQNLNAVFSNSSSALTAANVVALLSYLQIANFRTGRQLAPQAMLASAKDRLMRAADSGDDSFSSIAQMQYQAVSELWAPYIDEYRARLTEALREKRQRELSNLLEQQDLQLVADFVTRNSHGVQTFVTPEILSEFAKRFTDNRRFAFALAELIAERVKGSPQQLVYREFLEGLEPNGLTDRSDVFRLRFIKEKLSGTNRTS